MFVVRTQRVRGDLEGQHGGQPSRRACFVTILPPSRSHSKTTREGMQLEWNESTNQAEVVYGLEIIKEPLANAFPLGRMAQLGSRLLQTLSNTAASPQPGLHQQRLWVQGRWSAIIRAHPLP